jgi:hypothetical protein
VGRSAYLFLLLFWTMLVVLSHFARDMFTMGSYRVFGNKKKFGDVFAAKTLLHQSVLQHVRDGLGVMNEARTTQRMRQIDRLNSFYSQQYPRMYGPHS